MASAVSRSSASDTEPWKVFHVAAQLKQEGSEGRVPRGGGEGGAEGGVEQGQGQQAFGRRG